MPRLRKLEDVADYYDAADDGDDDEEEEEAYDEDEAYGDGGDDDGATYRDVLRGYEKRAEQTYLDMFEESPASWTTLEWCAFAALLLLFSSCCFCVCLFCIVPRVCRKRTVEMMYTRSLLV